MISGGIMRPLAEPLAWRPRIRRRMSDGSNMDEPITGTDSSERRRCTVCGEKASFGFGPPGSPALDADAWYCGAHQAEGDRRQRRIGAGRLAYALSLLHPPVSSHILDKGFDKL
jgi:hypothetical protein